MQTTTDSTIRAATAEATVATQRRANTTRSASNCALEILSRFVGREFTHESVRIALELAYHTGGRDQLANSLRDFAADLKRESAATVAQS